MTSKKSKSREKIIIEFGNKFISKNGELIIDLENARTFDTIGEALHFGDSLKFSYPFYDDPTNVKIKVFLKKGKEFIEQDFDGEILPSIKNQLPVGDYFLSGSQNLGVAHKDSDWDFICDKEQLDYLRQSNFELITNSTYLDFNSHSLWQKDNIQIIVCENLEARKIVDDLIKNHSPALCRVLKKTNKYYVSQLYCLLYESIGLKTTPPRIPSDLKELFKTESINKNKDVPF